MCQSAFDKSDNNEGGGGLVIGNPVFKCNNVLFLGLTSEITWRTHRLFHIAQSRAVLMKRGIYIFVFVYFLYSASTIANMYELLTR